MNHYNTILDFWFGNPAEYTLVSPERMKLWFAGSEETNKTICQQFKQDTELACEGKLDDWEKENDSLIALLILLDQFSRNIYRNTKKAFASDAKALAISQSAIESSRDFQLAPLQRVFLYLPLEHSENLNMQNLSVDKYIELANSVSEEHKPTYRGFVDYANQHQQIIARFGRFPHRNSILGRESSAEELAFLQQPGSSF